MQKHLPPACRLLVPLALFPHYDDGHRSALPWKDNFLNYCEDLQDLPPQKSVRPDVFDKAEDAQDL
ncbi:hypothetical protein FAI41_04305 [Acetobacteraceae bacterium]|nr:hypothetical protein FAI41_04305 [Acetobacteraceae bacterium]